MPLFTSTGSWKKGIHPVKLKKLSFPGYNGGAEKFNDGLAYVCRQLLELDGLPPEEFHEAYKAYHDLYTPLDYLVLFAWMEHPCSMLDGQPEFLDSLLRAIFNESSRLCYNQNRPERTPRSAENISLMQRYIQLHEERTRNAEAAEQSHAQSDSR